MRLKKGLIVSCQSEKGSSFDDVQSIVNFAKEAERGGAVGVRIRDVDNVCEVSKNISIPIVGLTKTNYENGDVWITPSWNQAKDLVNAGLPTPVGPENMKEPIGRLGSLSPARLLRIARLIATIASC